MVSHKLQRYSKISCRSYHWGFSGLCGQSLLEFLPGYRAVGDFETNPIIFKPTMMPRFRSGWWGHGQWSRLSLTSVLHVLLYQTICRWSQGTIRFKKALGYSNGQLAKRFWAFGPSLSWSASWLSRFISWWDIFATFVMRRGSWNHHSFSLAKALACFWWSCQQLSYGSDYYARRQLQTPALRLLKKSPSPIKVKGERGFLRERLPKELSSLTGMGRKSILFCLLAPCVQAMVH